MKISTPKGMRDFSPSEMAKRNFIFNTIEKHFKRFGFEQIETPTMENRETLTGKYGEEGDRLIYSVLNSGDYLSKVSGDISSLNSNSLKSEISDKALRYDLTVPFARYVVQHQNDIAFPFKRYQIQPVWRADRPQKGRYREFYQCDADIIGSDSLINEVELIQLFDLVLAELGMKDYTIKFNHRKLLNGLAEMIGRPEKLIDITIAIDKLDKIGVEKVKEELEARDLSKSEIDKLEPLFGLEGNNREVLESIKTILADIEVGLEGIAEVEEVLDMIDSIGLKQAKLQLDLSLARGLNYYTGCIFEVVSNEVEMGSICGGGRYDDLTGIFGLKGMSGVGISFGADRIYDVMEQLKLFPEDIEVQSQLMIANFGKEEAKFGLGVLKKLREAGIASEIYPDAAKLGKQFKYADQKQIPYVLVIGAEEIKSGKFQLKNMKSGEQDSLEINEVIDKLK
ncbi:MAG: histidine--tRNA ligase [Flavobacteriales bacterium]|nr:histidine--tRNA ligase [Flavobacteriales bacterium]